MYIFEILERISGALVACFDTQAATHQVPSGNLDINTDTGGEAMFLGFAPAGTPRHPELLARQQTAEANSHSAEVWLANARQNLAVRLAMANELAVDSPALDHRRFRNEWTKAVSVAEAAYGEDGVTLALNRLALSKYR